MPSEFLFKLQKQKFSCGLHLSIVRAVYGGFFLIFLMGNLLVEAFAILLYSTMMHLAGHEDSITCVNLEINLEFLRN